MHMLKGKDSEIHRKEVKNSLFPPPPPPHKRPGKNPSCDPWVDLT